MKTHNIKPGFSGIYEKDGKMYAREQCTCGGCFDNTYEIEENDTVICVGRLGLSGHLKKLKIVSRAIFTGPNTILDYVVWTHPDNEMRDLEIFGNRFD